MPHNNTGYDIHSTTPKATPSFIEVKGRIAGAEDFTITLNEVLLGKNVPAAHRLVMVGSQPRRTRTRPAPLHRRALPKHQPRRPCRHRRATQLGQDLGTRNTTMLTPAVGTDRPTKGHHR